MKTKIIYLIIGILIGAIITAGCFMIFGKNQTQGQMPDGSQMRQMDGNMTGGPGGNGGTPPSGNMTAPSGNSTTTQSTNSTTSNGAT